MLYYYKVKLAYGDKSAAVIASMFPDLERDVVINHCGNYVRVLSNAMSFDEVRSNPDLRALMFLN